MAILNHTPYGNTGDDISNNLFQKVFIEQGHECKIIPFAGLSCSSFNNKNCCFDSNGVSYMPDKVLHNVNVVIPRVDARSASELEWILTIMEGVINQGIDSLIGVQAFRNAEDKGRAMLLLAKNNISTPHGSIIGFYPGIDLDKFKDPVLSLGGYPLVLKHPYGWGGMGVIKIESHNALNSTLDFIGQLGYRGAILIQKFIPHDYCISAATVDNKIISVTAKMPGKDFRCKGGTNINEPLPKNEEELVLKVAKVFDIKAATIDFVRSDRGPLVLEVNACPGLCDPEDLPFAKAVSNYLEYNLACETRSNPLASAPLK